MHVHFCFCFSFSAFCKIGPLVYFLIYLLLSAAVQPLLLGSIDQYYSAALCFALFFTAPLGCMYQDLEDRMVIEYEDRMVMGAAFALHHMFLHPFGCMNQALKTEWSLNNEDRMVMVRPLLSTFCCCTPWLHISGW